MRFETKSSTFLFQKKGPRALAEENDKTLPPERLGELALGPLSLFSDLKRREMRIQLAPENSMTCTA